MNDTHEPLPSETQQDNKRFTELGKIFSGTAHDINNQLMIALNHLSFLMDSPTLSEGERKSGAKTFDAVLYSSRLLNQTLHLIRGEGLLREPVSLIEILNQTIKNAVNDGSIYLNRVRVLENYDHSTPLIKGDSLQLKRVFMNLLQNSFLAIKESKKGETIWIRVWHDTEKVFASITDNGPGLPESVLQNPQQPLYTTRREQGGSGLGLMIVHQIMASHNGQILMKNTAQGGSEITAVLPIH